MTLEELFARFEDKPVDAKTVVELSAALGGQPPIDPAVLKPLKATFSDLFDPLFQFLAFYLPEKPEDAAYRAGLDLIKRVGHDDHRALMALFHHVTGLDISDDNRKILLEHRDTWEGNGLTEVFEHIAKCRSDECIRGPVSAFKRNALPLLLETVEDTRALALLGYSALEKYEADVSVRSAALCELHAYCANKSLTHRPKNVEIVMTLLGWARGDSQPVIRRLVYNCHNVLPLTVGPQVALSQIDCGQSDPDPKLRQQELGRGLNRAERLGLGSPVGGVCRELAKAVAEERDETTKNALLRELRDPRLYYLRLLREHGCRELRRRSAFDAFIAEAEGWHYPSDPSAVDAFITEAQAGLKEVLDALENEIRREDGWYGCAVEAAGTYAELANRADHRVRSFLIEALRHFERQGQTVEAKDLEWAIGLDALRQLPCKAGQCVAVVSERNERELGHSFAYQKRPVSYSVSCILSLPNGCENASHFTRPHFASAFFYQSRCLAFRDKPFYELFHDKEIGRHYYVGDEKARCTDSGPFPLQSFLSKADMRPRLHVDTIKRIDAAFRGILEFPWLAQVPEIPALQRMLPDIFRIVWKKTPTNELIRSRLSDGNPPRELVMALLDCMAVLSIGDVETQELLFDLLGKDAETQHWHEGTRIRIIGVIAAISRGEPLPHYDNRKALSLLSLIENRDETPDVKVAALAAKEALNNASTRGDEMMLAGKVRTRTTTTPEPPKGDRDHIAAQQDRIERETTTTEPDGTGQHAGSPRGLRALLKRLFRR